MLWYIITEISKRIYLQKREHGGKKKILRNVSYYLPVHTASCIVRLVHLVEPHATVNLPSAVFFPSLERFSWEEKVHCGLSQLMFIQGISWKDTRSGRLLSAFDSRVIWALLAPDLY